MRTKTKPQGSYPLAVFAFLVGLAIAALVLFANWQFGHTLGLSEAGKWTQSGLTVGIDVGFAVAAAATGWLLRRRMPMCIVTGLVAFAFGLFTFTSLVGWSASERVAKADIALAEAKAEHALAQETNDLIKSERKELLDWARSTTAKRMPTARRREILTTLKDVMDQPPKLQKVIDVESVAFDAQADVLVKTLALFGFDLDKRDVLLVMIVWLAGLGIIGKGFFLALGAYLWPSRDFARHDGDRVRELSEVADLSTAMSLPRRPDNDVEPAAMSTADLLSSERSQDEEIAHPVERSTAEVALAERSTVDISRVERSTADISHTERSTAEVAHDETDASEVADLIVSAIESEHADKPNRKLTAERSYQLALVKLFLAEETRPDRNAKHTATFFHERFKRWVAAKDLGIEMSLNAFGARCNELGVQKLDKGRCVLYLGMAPVSDLPPAEEVPGAAAA
jgi:hypothetical protein